MYEIKHTMNRVQRQAINREYVYNAYNQHKILMFRICEELQNKQKTNRKLGQDSEPIANRWNLNDQ